MKTRTIEIWEVMWVVLVISILLSEVAFSRSAAEWGSGALQDDQRTFPRVRNARMNHAETIDSIFSAEVLEYPSPIYLRIFKYERVIELWAYSSTESSYVFLKPYPFTGFCGHLGPKRKQGDLQIPEGFYSIILFNPASNFHLSMKINYPNRSDRILGNPDRPGNEIFIHGSNVTIGCIPIGDNAIEELYIIALDSKSAGYDIPVHIFPCNFIDSSCAEIRRRYSERDTTISNFWNALKAGYDIFDTTCIPPIFSIDENGNYSFTDTN